MNFRNHVTLIMLQKKETWDFHFLAALYRNCDVTEKTLKLASTS